MKLVACPACHAQYDVRGVVKAHIQCHCGECVSTTVHAAVDAEVRRCGSCGAGVDPGIDKCTFCRSSIRVSAQDLSLICPECYGRNTERSSFCTGCGVRFRPEVPVEEGEELSCPACEDRTLTARAVGGARVWECAGCRGLWAPEASFDQLVERATETYKANPVMGLGGGHGKRENRSPFDAEVVYRSCPECGGRMQRKNYGRRSGVIVDWCGMHGTWFDADELEDIAGFIVGGGLHDELASTAYDRIRGEIREDQKRMKIRAETKRTTVSFATEDDRGPTFADLLLKILGW